MGYSATAVKQTGLGQQEGSATDRGGASRLGRMGCQPAHQATISKRRLHVQRTWNHDGVDLHTFELRYRRRLDRHPLGRQDRSTVEADRVTGIAVPALLLHELRR